MPVMTVRVTHEEAKRLRELRVERGVGTLSALMRQSLGLRVEEGTGGPEEALDELEGMTRLVSAMHHLVGVVERNERVVRRMAVALGLRGVLRVGSEDAFEREMGKPVEEDEGEVEEGGEWESLGRKAVGEGEPADIGDQLEGEAGEVRMPEGFERE